MIPSTSVTIYADAGEQQFYFDPALAEDAWVARLDAAFPNIKRIGVISPTNVEAICCWRAILLSGRVPVMLHFPTPKLSRNYWKNEINHAVDALGIDGLAHWGPQANPGLSLPLLDLAALGPAIPALPVAQIEEGRALQLSSGTTGYRKGVSMALADVMTHVADYNMILGLGTEDCIVSWLPLYHDMGFIANFIMPILLGVRLVLVDPISWVRRPSLLFELIDRHRGTICFMPNFGFEVMARKRVPEGVNLGSMRRWISCSEPTRMTTMQRFMDATRTAPDKLANCYAMAENIFAVTQSNGLRCEIVKGPETEIVSCGRPIPGVAIKIVDGEIWVRSAYSLTNYQGGPPIVDREGYYPTGDVGEIIDGELYLIGRKHDVINHAGRKYMLSDLDHELSSRLPESAGRICAFNSSNELLGTEEAVCLLEHERCWSRNRDAELINSLRQSIGLEQSRIEFVPPGFITKTSSGKINRRQTGVDWAKVKAARPPGGRQLDDLCRQIMDIFPELKPDLSFDQQLDSLGRISFALLLEEFDLDADRYRSLRDLQAQEDIARQTELGPVLNIVSLFDMARFQPIVRPILEALGRQMDVSIHYKHVCTPPVPILMSDFIFDDYFMARDGRETVYDGLHSSLMAIRQADVVIIDDMVNIAWPNQPEQRFRYPRINHRFEQAPLSQYMAVRWTPYSERNHLIATDVVEGRAILPSNINSALADFEDYLGVPVIRVALTNQFLADKESWHIHSDHFDLVRWVNRAENFPDLANKLFETMSRICRGIKPRTGVARNVWNFLDQPHWCSWLVDPAAIDFVLERYDSFLVLGRPGSVPYLANEASRRGKKLTFRSDIFCPPESDYECVLQTGSWGTPTTNKPIFPIMQAGWGPTPRNVPESVANSFPHCD